MSKTLQTILTYLRKQPVSTASIVDLIKRDNTLVQFGLDTFFNPIITYDKEFLEPEIRNSLINVIELTINEQKEVNNSKFNSLIVKNSYTHFQEIVTSIFENSGNQSIIQEYEGKEQEKSLEYYVLHPLVPEKSFKIGDITFGIEPLSEIQFIDGVGERKRVTYKFRITARCISDPISIKDKFERFKLETLYHIIGMSFLNTKYITITRTDDSIIMNIDTYPFYEDLANKYNSYYSNVRGANGVKLSELEGIELCYFDSNGLILVPKLFYLSSIYLDGDVATRPFIYDINKANEQIPLKMNSYRLSISFPKTIHMDEAELAIESFISRMRDFGINISAIKPRDNKVGNKININIIIDGYYQFSEEPDYQSEISSKLRLESKVSFALRKLCQMELIGPNDYSKNGMNNTQGNETYIFIYDKDVRSIKSNYDRGVSKFTIYFNRSAYTLSNPEDPSSILLSTLINERNTFKYKFTETMCNVLSQNGNRIEYNRQAWPDIYTNYIPTSFLPIIINKREKVGNELIDTKSIGISFLPFGFSRITSTDINISSSDGGFSIYGSDIGLTPVKTQKVIKITTDNKEIPNLFQIVIESSDIPKFESSQPLKVFQLDSFHYLAIFKSTSDVKLSDDIVWSYASEYTQNSQENETDENNVISLTAIMTPRTNNRITKSSYLRYFIETLTIENSFKSAIFDNENLIFGNEDIISLSHLCDLFITGKLPIDDINIRFFELLKDVSGSTINDDIFDWIINLSETSSLKTPQVIKGFIKSIQKPVNSNSYPSFSTELQSKIMKGFNDEINNAINKVYTIIDSIVDKTASEIRSFSTSHQELIRYLISLIADQVEKTGTKSTRNNISEYKNEIILYLQNLITEPILGNMLGFEITPSFILKSTSLHSELFLRFIKSVYSLLINNGYDERIIKLCKSLTSQDENFIVTCLSPYIYEISCNSYNKKSLLSVCSYIYDLDVDITITDEREEIFEFGEFTFDSNIHCMFEVEFDCKDSLKNIIMQTLKNGRIYYTHFGSSPLLTDLSIVSIFYDNLVNGSQRRKVNFFLPFSHSGGKLTVEKSSWVEDSSHFKLSNKGVEIEIVTGDISDKLSISRKIMTTSVIEVDNSNINCVKSLCIGLEPISRLYKLDDRLSFYVFTENLSEYLISGTYTPQNGSITNEIWSDELNSVSISIFPVPNLVFKHCLLSGIKESYEFIKSNMGFGFKQKVIKDEINNLVNNYQDLIVSPFPEKSKTSEGTLIIQNEKGIYTRFLSNRDIESVMSSGVTPFNRERVEVDMSNINELTNIERLIIEDKVSDENYSIQEMNKRHNLALTLSSIKWSSKRLENYRFFSNEKPKWTKFSSDSYFMAIGFQSGVKVYIKSGSQYVFCENLHHENAKDIIFGNKNLCITLQYEDSSRDFGYLWITSPGIKLPIPINFYTPVTGDAVNIKYISGNTAKEKNNVFITVDSDGKFLYNTNVVQSAEPIFNHNIYFFSPDDRYLILNDKGTFVVYETSKLEKVSFESFNGTVITSNNVPIKCFESGTWISESVFVGITYSSNNSALKQKIVVDIANKSINQSPLIPEFPTETISSPMLLETKGEIHPLYSFMMSKREEMISNGIIQDGIWIYDLYISISRRKSGNKLIFTTIDGHNDFYDQNIDILEGDFDIQKTLINLVSIFEFETLIDTKGVHIYSISWMGKVIFNRSKSERSEFPVLQYYEGNYFSYYEDSVFVWKYFIRENGEKYTEMTHIDSEGYEKFVFEDYVTFLLSDEIKIGMITDGFMSTVGIEKSNKVIPGRNPEDISKIVVSTDEKYQTNFLAYTELSFENYGHQSDPNPVVIDSKPISSNLCLNRFRKYTLKTHSDINNGNYVSHDNLLINVDKNIVKIIPKTIQTASSIDGLTSEWYKSNDDNEDYWREKREMISNYLDKIYNVIPQINPNNKRNTDIKYDLISEIFKMRNSNNIELGFEDAKDQGISSEIIDAMRFIFNMLKRTSYLYNFDSIKSTIDSFWDKKTNNDLFKYLLDIEEDKREEEYEKLVYSLRIIFGDFFISWKVGQAFSRISDNQFINVNGVKKSVNLSDLKKSLLNQLPTITNQSDIEIISIILLVIEIPLPDTRIVQILSVNDFNNRLHVLKGELNRISQMESSLSRFDRFSFLEINNLRMANNKYLKQAIAIRSKIYPNQEEPDFIFSLFYKPERFSTDTSLMVFDDDDKYIDGDYYIFKVDDNDVIKILRNQYKCKIVAGVISEVYDYIIKYLRRFGKDEFKETVTLEKINKMMGRRELIDGDLKYESYSKQLKEFLMKDFIEKVDEDIILSILRKFGEDVDIISRSIKTFSEMSELDLFLRDINEIRFMDSVYETFTDENLPLIYRNIKENYDKTLPIDSDKTILDFNIPYVDEMFMFYSSCLRKGYYVSDGTYEGDFMSIRNILKPLLWKYRNGVSDDLSIPVTAIKLVFPRNVKLKEKSQFKQSEWDDIDFEYELPEELIKHDNKYGIVSVNLANLIIDMKRTASVISDSFTYKTNLDVDNKIDSLSEAVRFDILTKEKAMSISRNLLPPVDQVCMTFDEYKTRYTMKYKISEIGKKEEFNAEKFLSDWLPKSPLVLFNSIDLNYTFDYKFAGLDFPKSQIKMVYWSDRFKRASEEVDFTSENISYGLLKPYFFNPKLIVDKNGNPAVFSNSSLKFIVYYGNTMKDKLSQGFIVTQNLLDRKTSTYIYTAKKKNRGKDVPIATYITSISYDSESDNINIIERVEEERYERGKGYVTFKTDNEISTNIISFINKLTLIPQLSLEKYNESVVISNTIKSKENILLISTNYKCGSFFGSTIELYNTGKNDIKRVQSWNFQSLNIKTIDFNNKEILIVGTTQSVNGYRLRVGIMNINSSKNDSGKKSCFVTSFNKEISLGNGIIENLDDCTCNTGKFLSPKNGTTYYITYSSNKNDYLLIFNKNSTYEIKLQNKVTSSSISKENGYIAVYFESLNMTEIWNCNGNLHETIEGKCMLM